MAKVEATFQVKVIYDTQDWDLPNLEVDTVTDALTHVIDPVSGPDVEDVEWSVVRVKVDTE